MRSLTLGLLIFFPTLACAEIYQDIWPLDNLGDVKSKFPNASFESIDAAWVTENEAFYRVYGKGISGDIYVNFNDERAKNRKSVHGEIDDEAELLAKAFSEQPDEEALVVKWVRWAPAAPIPLKRLILKYGNPDKSDFSDQDLTPIRIWSTRGIEASLSDDEKYVTKIDFAFTLKEYRQAWKTKKGYIHPLLDEVKK